MAKLKNVPETYIFDYKKIVGEKWERKPKFEKGDLPENTDVKIQRVIDSVEHLNERFEKKDVKLKGKGRIENKFVILDIEAKDRAGNIHSFAWNIGMAGKGARAFSSRLTEEKMLDFLRTQQKVVETEQIREYKDTKTKTKVIMDFVQGFKVKSIIHRSIITSTPANLRANTRTMGRRNLHVKKL